MTNAEISRKLRIPKSSASYLLRTLERGGYLRREREGGKYRLGLKVLSLSHAPSPTSTSARSPNPSSANWWRPASSPRTSPSSTRARPSTSRRWTPPASSR